MKEKIVAAFFIAVVFIISGCSKGPKIVIPTYTAPKEAAKLAKIETKNEYIAQGAYLALWLDPDVKGVDKTSIDLKTMLLQSIKSAITQTNFIALDPIDDDASVALRMQVLGYRYTQEKTQARLYLEVSFTLSRGTEEFFVRTYAKTLRRQAADAASLPTEERLAAEAAKILAKYFISDISVMKTYQLREFKPFGSDLEAAERFVKAKNYSGAIMLMRKYKGKKTKEYYYNLALLYEALSSKTERIEYLEDAKRYYERAMELGGSEDRLIVETKARFDRFYELLRKTVRMRKNNQALLKERNELLGSSDSEYE